MIYLQLFWSFLQIGMFSVGGGYAAMPLIQSQTVQLHQWLTMEEFSDLVTIAEMTPGPIAVNAASFVGIRMAGLGGAAAATMGCIFPSCILLSILATVYSRCKGLPLLQSILSGLRPAVVALIAGAGLSILRQAVFQGGLIGPEHIRWTGLLLFGGGFFVLRKWKWDPILVMLLCGGIQLIVSCLTV